MRYSLHDTCDVNKLSRHISWKLCRLVVVAAVAVGVAVVADKEKWKICLKVQQQQQQQRVEAVNQLSFELKLRNGRTNTAEKEREGGVNSYR